MASEIDRNLRIGEFSRRSGVSADLLRAWERRYGLFAPSRTAGGYRLYGAEDVRRSRLMREHLSAGLSAAQAAQMVGAQLAESAHERATGAPAPVALIEELTSQLDALDERGAHETLDRLLSTLALETVLLEAVLPYLHELGERWQRGEPVITQEHFASALLRGRLLGLARGWGSGAGPLALLACVPGDQHDLGLVCFGLALRTHGWRIAFFGADTPLASAIEAAGQLQPALVMLAASLPLRSGAGLAELARAAPLALAGGASNAELAAEAGAEYVRTDPVAAAASIAAQYPGRDLNP